MTSVLVVGSGAREHAFVWKLAQSPRVDALYVAPGNAGTAALARNVPVHVGDIPGIVRLVEECDIDLTVVGPEEPLALGLADALRAMGRAVVGPGAAAARIESSKSFAKEVMRRAGVPTAAYAVYDDHDAALRYLRHARYPLVIKADGLAAGKGVVLCAAQEEAQATLDGFMLRRVHGMAGSRIVIEEMLTGPEVSLLALVDGERIVPLPPAQDHKRLGDGDTGPNTGGMGAYAPVSFFTEAEGASAWEATAALAALTIEPVVQTLREMNMPYRGILFAGLMLTPAGPRVLEFNCRSGDPETQVVLPLIGGDLLPLLEAVAGGTLDGPLEVDNRCAVGVVLASPAYPAQPVTGIPIDGLSDVPSDVLVFHAGTAQDAEGRVVTAGGRVLTVVGTGRDVDEAAARAYAAPIRFAGMQRRTDIGRTALRDAGLHPASAQPDSNRERTQWSAGLYPARALPVGAEVQ